MLHRRGAGGEDGGGGGGGSDVLVGAGQSLAVG